MKNPSATAFATALAMRAEEKPWPEVLAATGLNYSQAWLFVERSNLPADLDLEAAYATDPTGTVAAARAEGNSWGLIAVRCAKPESQIRKQFAQATGTKSQGQRIGKGGRFYYGISGEPLYQDVLKPTGTVIPVGADLGVALDNADSQRFMRLSPEQVRALAAEAGISPKGKTVAQLRKLIKANAK